MQNAKKQKSSLLAATAPDVFVLVARPCAAADPAFAQEPSIGPNR